MEGPHSTSKTFIFKDLFKTSRNTLKLVMTVPFFIRKGLMSSQKGIIFHSHQVFKIRLLYAYDIKTSGILFVNGIINNVWK